MSNHPARRRGARRTRPPTRGPDLAGLRRPEPFDDDGFVVVSHLEWRGPDPWDLSGDDALALAFDQRAFGPGQLIVACARRDGTVLRLNHTDQTDPPEVALAACLDAPGLDAAAAVAYSDEPARQGEAPTPDMGERFVAARAVAALHRIHLVDWWLCEEDAVRSLKSSTSNDAEWWDVP